VFESESSKFDIKKKIYIFYTDINLSLEKKVKLKARKKFLFLKKEEKNWKCLKFSPWKKWKNIKDFDNLESLVNSSSASTVTL